MGIVLTKEGEDGATQSAKECTTGKKCPTRVFIIKS